MKTDTSFWNKLYKDSKSFEEPVLYKNFFDRPLLTDEEVKILWSNWKKQPFLQAINDVDMSVKGLQRNVYDQPLYEISFGCEKSLEELYFEVFGKNKTSIILKSAEKYFEPLALRVSDFIQPLIDKFKIPQIEWTTSLIMGRYEFTPFGVHFDAGDQRAIHTIIGKGSKKMYFWKRKLVNEIMRNHDTNIVRCYNANEITKLLKYAKQTNISEGDFYLLPIQHYHIGYVEGFTIGLVIVLDRVDQRGLVQRAFRQKMSLLSDNFQKLGPYFEPDDIDYLNSQGFIDDFTDKNWLKYGLENEVLKKRSNNGMISVPQVKENKFKSLGSCIIQINSPFQILHKSRTKELIFYVRGREIPLSIDGGGEEENTELISIIDRLNNGEKLEYSLIENLMTGTMDKEIGDCSIKCVCLNLQNGRKKEERI